MLFYICVSGMLANDTMKFRMKEMHYTMIEMDGNPGRPPYVIPRGSAGLKKRSSGLSTWKYQFLYDH